MAQRARSAQPNHRTGEWLLFSDADVTVSPSVLRRVIAHCERGQIDHCTVVPSCDAAGPLLDGVVAVFVRLLCLGLRIWAIEDPRSRASVGAGAFNLVRRRALDRTKGFEWLKMEVADDVALGQMLKDAGAKQSVDNGRGLTWFMFHESFGDTLRAFERASYTTIGNFKPARLVALGLALAVLELSPLIALAASPAPVTSAASIGLLVVTALAMLVANRWFGRPASQLLLAPFGALFWGYGFIRSGVLGKLRGGIVWRDTFYSEAELRAGRRVRI